jgi:hypothetical protein
MVQRTNVRHRGLKGEPEPPEGEAGGMLRDVQHVISQEYHGLQNILAKEICKRPLTSVLATLGLGFFLGRYRVRPVETVLLAGGTGLLAGMALSIGCSGRGDPLDSASGKEDTGRGEMKT